MKFEIKLHPVAIARAMRERLYNKPNDWFVSLDGEWLQSHATGFRIRLRKGRTPIGISTVGSGAEYTLGYLERLYLQKAVIEAINRHMLTKYRQQQIKAHEPAAPSTVQKSLPEMLREQAA